MQLCEKNDIKILEQDITLSQLYNADGVFATGTMGELTPIVEIDGREIKSNDILTQKVLTLFKGSIRKLCGLL